MYPHAIAALYTDTTTGTTFPVFFALSPIIAASPTAVASASIVPTLLVGTPISDAAISNSTATPLLATRLCVLPFLTYAMTP
eukprot:CAMPEP_0182615524 /NCGR_PEP_ID=MMETSP1330-20130603/35068_1 /TAXON_ID=464278 /ORGANISM="Picochlorum sp., Strain RCC944" /LENGTH=81 /DNA_ID=CAMNT_0024835459 /DNA_START=365 /DNA_END=606 /DNA_ORIENTATION=+